MYTEKEASKMVDQTGLLGRPEVYGCLRPTLLVNVYTTSFHNFHLLLTLPVSYMHYKSLKLTQSI